jgi:hypothetical protein
MSRPPQTWKHAERAIARLLGGWRCHFEGKDVDAGEWSVEVKHGRQIPRTLLKWWEQAQRNTPDGERLLLVLHPPRIPYEDSLVVLRLSDFVRAHDAGDDGKAHSTRIVELVR